MSSRSVLSFSKHLQNDDANLEINLTPLIDIVFLLLIFFMLSTTFVDTRQLPVELPTASSKAKSDSPDVTEIRIAADGSMQIDGKNTTLENIRTELSSKKEKVSIVLRADKAATHGTVVGVMDIAQQLGIKSISVAVQSK